MSWNQSSPFSSVSVMDLGRLTPFTKPELLDQQFEPTQRLKCCNKKINSSTKSRRNDLGNLLLAQSVRSWSEIRWFHCGRVMEFFLGLGARNRQMRFTRMRSHSCEGKMELMRWAQKLIAQYNTTQRLYSPIYTSSFSRKSLLHTPCERVPRCSFWVQSLDISSPFWKLMKKLIGSDRDEFAGQPESF
jgi:hypothetical protein